ncbi:hypothetical protein N658DRAFT_503185 [Parathielavia hyrcaniae]|uniref:Uncharacterized protein n=1 Tax=Parathielavia hyrcaniae TaxID=113614 RepID=A0AAN6T7D9_9PEZI|nr:hypothetical protein N658DRAFT_503185 [Parathielavia hyrcaniae]
MLRVTETIDKALRPVSFEDPGNKPFILIGVMGIFGEGVNGMQKACYSVTVDLPFSKALRAQVRSRTFRYGKVHASKHYELVSLHPAERAILTQHEKRDEEFQRILAGPAGDTGEFAGRG